MLDSDEYLVAWNFERLKRHPLSLAPLYVFSGTIIGLVRLPTIALRVLNLFEGVIRQNLSEQQREIAGLYAGNHKWSTN